MTVRVFEGPSRETDAVEPTADVGGPPRVALEGACDESAGEFVVASNPEPAPDSRAVNVEFLPQNTSDLDAADIRVEGTTARGPVAELEGPTSVYAAPFDGRRLGVTDQVVLNPRTESVSLAGTLAATRMRPRERVDGEATWLNRCRTGSTYRRVDSRVDARFRDVTPAPTEHRASPLLPNPLLSPGFTFTARGWPLSNARVERYP